MEKEIDIISMFNNMKNQIATDHVKIKSLVDLIVEKQIISEEEIRERFDQIFEKESNKLHDFLEKGKIEK